MAIRIITDSAADFSAQEIQKRDISCVPMSVSFGEENYLDGVTLTKEAFYEKLKKNTFPKTSQPSPDAFLKHFEEAKQAGDTIIAILLSGALSGTVQSARLARGMADYPHIHIIDSRTVTLGMRVLVNRAVELRRGGADAKQIVEELEALKPRIRIYAGLDTLEYLARGGRLPQSAANVAGLVSLKPIVTITREGTVSLIGKQIGVHRAYRRLEKFLREEPPDSRYPIYFLYAGDSRNSAGFIRHLQKNGIVFERPLLRGIGPTIGSHIGTGAFGIVYVKK